jgi:uncharacterized repeat protein (TIGR01451 family)
MFKPKLRLEDFSSGCSSGLRLTTCKTAAFALKSLTSIWRGVMFVTLTGLIAIFANNQAYANNVYEYIHAGAYEYFAGTTNVPNATVRINEALGTTSSDGSFGFHAKKADRYAISVNKRGYALASQIEQQPSTNMYFTLKKAERISLSVGDLANGVVVEDSRKTQIDLPPGAFGDVDEPVDAYVYTYDLANEPMPGDMSVAGRDGYLESAGVFSAEFVGKNSGKKYNLAAGKEAMISMPASVRDELPGLWHYDEASGKWVEGKSESVNLVNGRLQGKVGHFSTWNFDWYKSNPACFTINGTDSFFAAYGNSVQIKAVVKNTSFGTRSRTGNLSNSNANYRFTTLVNLPPNSTVDVYVQPPKDPDGQQPPLALFKENVSIGAGSNNQNCKSVDLNGTPVASSDGSALQITGNGEGIFFSWLLQEIDNDGNILKSYANSDTQTIKVLGMDFTIPTDPSDPSYNMLEPYHITATGISASLVAQRLAADIKNSGGPDLVTEGNVVTLPIVNNDGTDVKYVLYVGKQGETASPPMCQVTSSTSCKFNPTIKLITMKQALTSIRGTVWRDDVKVDGLQGLDEKPLGGIVVKLSPSNRTTLTDRNGYYEFTDLSAGTYTVSLESNVVRVYTTSETITRTVGNIYTDENIKIPRTANFGVKELSIITLNTVGRGAVVATLGPHTVSCNEVCSGFIVTSGASLNLNANPATGYSFVEWQDDCVNTESTTSLTMDSDKICTVVLNSNNTNNTGGSTGDNTGGSTGDNTGGSTGGNTGGNTGVETVENTGGETGSQTGGTVINNFDGNGDGIKDDEQDNVISLSNPIVDNVTLTLQASNNCPLKNVQIKRGADLSSSDDRTYPYGLVEFEAACAETEITMLYFLDTSDECCELGSTPTNGDSEWYTLENTTTEFVTIGGKRAIKSSFNLKDGELGDNTGVDGKIVNISGLALTTKKVEEPKGVVNLWIQDPLPDDGSEPGKATRIWRSPDVWVRNEDDGGNQYQNVKYGQDNYVYVRVRNIGTLPAKNTKVEVYRSRASLGQGWPRGWGLVGTGDISLLEPETSDILRIKWEKDNIPQPGHYCFYVRALNDDDPMFSPETNNMVQNTRTNNNVAWRNFNVVGFLNKVIDKFEVDVGNPTDGDTVVEVIFDEPENLLQNDGATAIVDLGAELFARWQAAGSQGENVQVLNGTEVQLLKTPAKFSGISLKVNESLPITMRVEVTKPMPKAGVSYTYNFSAQEFIDGELIGGVDYAITTRALDTDSDGDGIKDVEDDDNDNDGIPDDWEIANDLNPLNAEDAAEDLDGNGLTNLEEYTKETSPIIENANYVTSGIIRDELGNPIAGVVITIGDKTATTDANGVWEITGLSEAEYTVTASKEGYTFSSQTVELGNEELKRTIDFKPLMVLEVMVAVEPRQPKLGENVTYTSTVTNGGTQTATGVVLAQTLPEGTTLVSLKALNGGDCDKNTLTCTLPDLATGDTAKVQLMVGNAEEDKRLEMTATLTSNEYPTDVQVKRTSVTAYLSVATACSPKTIMPQAELNCTTTVELSEYAPTAATGVELMVTLPQGVELNSETLDERCVANTSTTFTCTLADLSVEAGGVSQTAVNFSETLQDPGLLLLTHEAQVSANEHPVDHQDRARTEIFIPAEYQVDMALVVDVTGSMQAEMNGVKKVIT